MAPFDITLAASPTTWGVDFADGPDNPPWQQVLDELVRAGLGALELGPVGYLPENPAALRGALGQRGLTAVGSFVFESLHDPGGAEQVLAVARRACKAISAAGGRFLVIIDRPGRVRAATAGKSAYASRLSKSRWLKMMDITNEVAELAASFDLLPAFHPHAGSYVEFADEIDRLLDDTEIPLCLDTGHLAYAGMVPSEALTRYASRLVHVHLKDVDPHVVNRARLEGIGFWQAIGASVFCPLGTGAVDLADVARALGDVGYSGYATIEQDRAPGTGAPLADLTASIELLKRAGIGETPDPASAPADVSA
jgi:inosose dehydratase